MRLLRPAAILIPLLTATLAAAADPPLMAPGRVAEIEGQLLLLPAGWDEWREAELNSAIAPGDWLRSSHDAEITLELSPSLIVQLAPRSELRVDREQDVLVLELLDGTLVVCSTDSAEDLSLVSPHGAAWLEPGGFYRLDVSARHSQLVVSAGRAELERNGHVRGVRPGRTGELSSGAKKPRVGRSERSGWDALSERASQACSRFFGDEAGLDLVGARDLEGQGAWVEIGGLRYWRPLHVSAGWSPYGDGCFRWHPSWGWYFVPRHRWGWVTHHHGWWSWHDPWGWVWYPDSWWHPHRVHFRVVGSHVYWCPRDRDRGRHRDRDHDHDHDHRDRGPHEDDKGPNRGWSRAPVEDFGSGPVVRAQRPLVGSALPQLRPLGRDDDDRLDPPVRVEAPPLPPRAQEPDFRGRSPVATRLEQLRQRLRQPGQPDDGEPMDRLRARRPAPAAPDLTVERPGPVLRDRLPTRPTLPERETAREPVVKPPERPQLPPPRIRPRPWPPRERPEDPKPERPSVLERLRRPPTERPSVRPAPAEPARVTPPKAERPVPTPRPVIRRPERPAPEPPKTEPAKERPKPVIRKPERRERPPRPVRKPVKRDERDGGDSKR